MNIKELARRIDEKISGVAPYEEIIISHFLDFLKNKYKMTVPVEVKAIKMAGIKNGSADIKGFAKGKYKIKVSKALSGGQMLIPFIGHEYLHVVQYINKDLQYDDEYILWKGKRHTSIADYNKIKWPEYIKLPWEIEALAFAKTVNKEFKSSPYFKELLKSEDPTIKYLIANNLLLY